MARWLDFAWFGTRAPQPAAALANGLPRTVAETLAGRTHLAMQRTGRGATAEAPRTSPAAALSPASRAPQRGQMAAISDLARTWPQGRLEEAPGVLATLIVALSQLVGWAIALIFRLLFGIAQLVARSFAFLAGKISGGRLRSGGSMIVGWLLVVVLLGATLAGLGLTHREVWMRFLPHASTPHHGVPYQAPPASCTQPRTVCTNPTEWLDGQPSLSVTKILAVLTSYHSPAATSAFANALYDLGVKYGVNPAYALGFFTQESTCGTQGLAVTTMSLGNIRYSQNGSPVSYTEYQGFRHYASWHDGAEDWYWLIRTYYLNQGIRAIFDITPIYAPSSDHNDPTQYANTVYQLVLQWSGS